MVDEKTDQGKVDDAAAIEAARDAGLVVVHEYPIGDWYEEAGTSDWYRDAPDELFGGDPAAEIDDRGGEWTWIARSITRDGVRILGSGSASTADGAKDAADRFVSGQCVGPTCATDQSVNERHSDRYVATWDLRGRSPELRWVAAAVVAERAMTEPYRATVEVTLGDFREIARGFGWWSAEWVAPNGVAWTAISILPFRGGYVWSASPPFGESSGQSGIRTLEEAKAESMAFIRGATCTDSIRYTVAWTLGEWSDAATTNPRNEDVTVTWSNGRTAAELTYVEPKWAWTTMGPEPGAHGHFPERRGASASIEEAKTDALISLADMCRNRSAR